jgi:hypothetical protein
MDPGEMQAIPESVREAVNSLERELTLTPRKGGTSFFTL